MADSDWAPVGGGDSDWTPVQSGGGQNKTDALTNYGYDPQQHSIGENLSHLWSNPVQHIRSTGMPDALRVAGNALGLGDWLHSTVTGLTHPFNPIEAQKADWDAQRAQTADASQRIGTPATIGASVLGSLPLAGVGTGGATADVMAPYLAKAVGPKIGTWGAGVIGSGTENAAVSGTTAFARGDDPVEAAKWGGILGTLTGLPGGVTAKVTSGGPKSMTTSQLKDLSDYHNEPLSDIHFDRDVVNAKFDAAKAAMSKKTGMGISGDMQTAIDKVSGQLDRPGSTDAAAIAQGQRTISGGIRNNMDEYAAQHYRSALDDVLSRERPLIGAFTGQAKPMVDDANAATKAFKTSQFFDEQLKKPGVAPSAVKAEVEKHPYFYDPATQENMTNIGGMREAMPWYSHFLARHATPDLISAVTGLHMGGLPGLIAGVGGSEVLIGGLNAIQRSRIATQLKNAQYQAVMGQGRQAGNVGRNLLRATGAQLGVSGAVPDALSAQ